MPIDELALERQVLSDGVEDWCGLYEIIWSLSTKHPGLSLEAKLAAAKPVVLRLLQRGHIQLARSTWGSDTLNVVPASESEELVRRADSWDSPDVDPDRRYLSFAATAEGELAYHGPAHERA